MYNDIIKLLNLEQFNLKILKAQTVKKDNTLFCYITLEKDVCACPFCGGGQLTLKDYRKKKIKHSISTNNPCYIIYNARRYKCKYCNNCFYEKNPFSLKYDKESVYTIYTVLPQLLNHTNTFTDVARNLNLSVTTVIKIFDKYVECRRLTLPPILCFDEFYRSKKSKEKYAFVMADFMNNKIVDVFHSRHKDKLDKYFCDIPQKERDSVKYIIIDMWDTYRDLATVRFKNAKIAIASFHVVKHVSNALDLVRKQIINKYNNNSAELENNTEYYYLLKKLNIFFYQKLIHYLIKNFIIKNYKVGTINILLENCYLILIQN